MSDTESVWDALGTPEQIQMARDELAAMDDVDMVGKTVHFSIRAVGPRISVLVHQVCENSAPLLGGLRMTGEQWRQLKIAVDPLVDAHERLVAGKS